MRLTHPNAGRSPHSARPRATTHPATTRTGTVPPTAAPRSARRRRRTAVLILVSVLVLTATIAAAPEAVADTALALPATVDELLVNIRNWIVGILAGLATVFLTLGGVRYVMAGGDPGEVEKAKTGFKAAGIGYALAALAPLVVTVLQSIVGA